LVLLALACEIGRGRTTLSGDLGKTYLICLFLSPARSDFSKKKKQCKVHVIVVLQASPLPHHDSFGGSGLAHKTNVIP